MPVDRVPISVSQLAELLGVEPPRRFVAVEHVCTRAYRGWMVVTEGDEMNTSGTFPALNTGGKRIGGKGGKKKGC